MLQTNRLILRGARPSDLDDLHRVMRDPRAMQFWSEPPHESPAQTQKNIDGLVARGGDRLTYFVVEKDGRLIGTAGMWKDDEIGFLLHPDYWRQGLMHEAMQAIIAYLFDITDHDRLTADVDPRNAASIALLGKLGFHETGHAEKTFFIAGVWADSVYFALPRPAGAERT